LKYASWNGSMWILQNVSLMGYIGGCSMALDSNNNPHIIYYIAGNFYYATWNGSAWSIQTIDSGGSYCSIALDSNNSPHISYYDATNLDLKYASMS
jgi:hypothetical protein